jgi:hypothetical protein
MSAYNNRNEWASVIQAQSYANLKHEMEEKSLKTLSKQVYQIELETQLKEKQQLKAKEVQEKGSDAQVIKQYSDALEKYEKELKNNKKRRQENLSLEYSSNINNKYMRNADKINFEKTQDKKIIDNVISQLEKDNLLRLYKKEQKIQSEKNFLSSSIKFKEFENQKRLEEKLKDQVLIQRSIENTDKRDKDHRDFFEKIYKTTEEKAKVYEKVISDIRNKEIEKSEIVSLWEEQANKKHQQNELFKIQNTLKTREEYKKILETQLANKNTQKFFDKLMTEKEKSLNSDIIKKIEKNEDVEFRAVPGIHPRISPLQYSFKKAYRNFTGSSEDFSGLSHRNLNQSSFKSPVLYNSNKNPHFDSSSSFKRDTDKHNPITNPLGSTYQNKNSFFRGRGLASLKSGNIFYNNYN